LLASISAWTAIVGSAEQVSAQVNADDGLRPILDYIGGAWDSLTRSMTECGSVVDPKIKVPPVLYLPKNMPQPDAVKKLAAACNVQIERLPIVIHRLGEIDMSTIHTHGLLYLPNKYVVPGGRFNEMYGWDSYFIIRGLLQSGRIELANGMVENFLFEIENYGAMLNANRTYYLTRSQPPFVSSMVVDVYNAMRKSQPEGQAWEDRAWLARAYDDLEKDYEMWTRPPHLAGDTGLSRYYDFGEGPAPEALQDETGYYQKVAEYFLFHPAQDDGYISEAADGSEAGGPTYTLQICGGPSIAEQPACQPHKEFTLSADYYKGDRSMRESGFDVSFRFKPFGAATQHFAPVCLNTLLYKTEKDLEQMSLWLGRRSQAQQWSARAEKRKKLINRYLWDEKTGLFFDWNLETGRRSTYRYATTFYPLWAGLSTPEQAAAVRKNLPLLEKPGGLAMSTDDTGAQWDLPYGWGNIEMLAIDGLRKYGFRRDAERVTYEFLSMVLENFRRDHDIVEKYNVVTRSSDAHAQLGYKINVVGFGWTNAAFLELLRDLPPNMRARLASRRNVIPPAQATCSGCKD
ncbi:MAG: trehalase family glycosidase, partial [Candidatus Sulfotelmatobacter sp.]